MPFDPKSLSLYPEEPGVYLMKDETGNVLYVGKAKNLKNRLKQYFQEARDSRVMIPYLIAQIKTIDTLVVLTEKDALLLENNLIKQHKPKYNVLLKDDKTFVSLLLTSHKWPMLKIVRHKTKTKKEGTYFGPYTNALAARQTFDLISKLFPLRQCSDAEFACRTRPCLLFEMKRCIAPCVGKCTEEEYQTHVHAAANLLKGKDQNVLEDLKAEMEKASNALEFEKAQKYLEMIEQIKHVTQVQHVDHPEAQNCDVLGFYREADTVLIALLLFREGKLIHSEHFSFHLIASDDEEVLESFLLQHYKTAQNLPKEIFLPFELNQRKALEEILSLSIHSPQKGKKKELIQMANLNAKTLFIREQDAKSLREKALLDLQEKCELNRFPKRIECLDTSNLSGTNAVASLVSFLDGEKDKKGYRLFQIREAQDDYSAMKEVLFRHLKKQKEKENLADLLIVDGGKGQLGIALEVFQALQIASMDVIALTKESARHDKGLTQEKIYVPYRKDPLYFDRRSPLLFFLQKIRDEAHRSAISYHRKKRSKKTLTSELDSIEGIGSIKKRALLTHFKSVKAIRNASEEELKKVKKLTQKDIQILLIWQKRD